MSRRLQWGLPETPPPKHPYRDTLIVYGGLVGPDRRGGVADERRRGQGGCDRRVLLRRRVGLERLPVAPAAAGRGGRTARQGGRAVTVAESIDGLVESLCGDLSSIHAPHGTALNARSWSTEAPLRMLLNNLDAAVAERPEDLVVYGGSGKAARSHEALKAIVRALLELGDDETLLVQSGKPVAVFRTTVYAPRVLIANSLLVPKWATWDEFRRLEAEGLTMFGQMTAGSWIYIGTQGILQGTYQTFAAAGEKHFGSPSLAGRTDPHRRPGRDGRRPAARGDARGRGDPLRRGRPVPDRPPARDALPRRGDGLAGGRARPGACRRGGGPRALGRPARERGRRRARARAARGALRSRDRPDGRPRSADRLRAAGSLGRGGRRAAHVRSGRVPAAGPGLDRRPRGRDARVRPGRQLCFRLWQQPAR